VTSGVRVGTAAATTRGFVEEDARLTGELIARTLANRGDAGVLDGVRAAVKELVERYPLYPELG
jgi:glycine hydroxymethyltransferase